VALPIAEFYSLKCLLNLSFREQPLLPVLRAQCVQLELGRETSCSKGGSVSAAQNSPTPRILKLNTEGEDQRY